MRYWYWCCSSSTRFYKKWSNNSWCLLPSVISSMWKNCRKWEHFHLLGGQTMRPAHWFLPPNLFIVYFLPSLPENFLWLVNHVFLHIISAVVSMLPFCSLMLSLRKNIPNWENFPVSNKKNTANNFMRIIFGWCKSTCQPTPSRTQNAVFEMCLDWTAHQFSLSRCRQMGL